MTENTIKTAFDKLEHQPPSPGAEDRAIEAGLAAFRLSRQKSASRPRPIFGGLHATWEWIMGQRMAVGGALAAVVGVVVISGVMLDRSGGDAVDIVTAASDIAPQGEETLAKADGVDLSSATPSPPVAANQAPPQPNPGETAERLRLAVTPQANPSPPPMAAGVAHDESGARVAAISPPDDRIVVPEFEPPAGGYPSAVSFNDLKLVSEAPVSTFSIDVDTASYALVRRMLEQGILPAPGAVRVEEMINYFSYDYPLPDAGDAPFRPTVAVYPTPWNAGTRLLHIGIKGRDIAPAARPHANLVFLIDTSGSMQGPDRLPLLKTAFRMLLDTLDDEDTVAIVTYAGDAGIVLKPTRAGDKKKIVVAITNLRAGGSTAGSAGIAEAYALVEQSFDETGVNRVILATDGDFNVGMTDIAALKAFVADKRNSGVFLSVLGFGEGNYNDPLMQVLAQNGNGNAAYIDTLKEAEKVLVNEATSTLFPIAKDVKIQIEFNPAKVSAYRLIGYETRMLRRQDFNNDRIDAGEIGSGHTVTAIYEITPAGAALVDNLRYARPVEPAVLGNADEYALLKLRYKQPQSDQSEVIEFPVTKEMERASVDGISGDMRFAAAVAAFGQKLQGVSDLERYPYADIEQLAGSARDEDRFGLRGEFIELVRLASYLSPAEVGSSGGR